MLTNDELLYDPDMDDEDEKWVIKQRRDHRQKGMTSHPVAPNPLYFLCFPNLKLERYAYSLKAIETRLSSHSPQSITKKISM